MYTPLLLNLTGSCLFPEEGCCSIFEGIMVKNFPKFMTDIQPHIQEVQSTSSRINTEKNLHWGISYSNYRKQKPRQSLERSQKEKKNLTYRGSRVSIIADFSSEIMQARGEWREIFTVERRKPRLENKISKGFINIMETGSIIFNNFLMYNWFIINCPCLNCII